MVIEGQAQALATAAGIFMRNGNLEKGAELTKQLDKIKSTTNLNDVVAARTPLVSMPTVYGVANKDRPYSHGNQNKRNGR